MNKTAAFLGMNALRNLVSESIAIDMGSAATIIYVQGRGVVVDEPSLVGVNTITGEVVAIGLEAQQMYGREARDVTVIAPLLDGVVADFERTKAMLAHFVRKARRGNSYFSRSALMSVLFGITQVERRALLSAAEHARIGRVAMIEEGLAAAFGGGVRVDDPRASAVVDIGSGTTIYMNAESSLLAAVRNSAAWTTTCVNIPNYQCGSPMSPDLPSCVVSRRCSTNLFGYAASFVPSLTLMRGLIITVSNQVSRPRTK